LRQHLQLLARSPDIAPILALRSLAPSEWGEFESTDREPPVTVRTEGEGAESRRMLAIGESVVVTTRCVGDDVEFSVANAQLPDDLRAVLAAAGIPALAHGRPLRICAEQFFTRLCTLDAGWVLLRRIRNCTGPDQAVSIAEQVLDLGLRWNQNQAAMCNRGESPASLKVARALQQESEELLNEHSGWMTSLRLLDDPRGAAIEIGTRGFDHPSSSAALIFDWRPAPCASGEPVPIVRHGSGRYAIRPTKLKPAVLDALSAAVVSGHEVRLVQRLSKALYANVNDVLQTLGGEWSTAKQAHVFHGCAATALNSVMASGELYRREDFEFFWTAEDTARRVIALARLRPGMTALEPSAGDGALARPAADIVGQQNVSVFELMPQNVKRLREQGFAIEAPVDFLATEPTPTYSVVIMNPPFSGGRDMAHILHAMRWLVPGGRLVAIASTSWRTQRSSNAERFRTLLSELDAEVAELDRGAFKEAGTDVPTTLIAFNVPGAPVSTELPQAAARVSAGQAPSPTVSVGAQLEFF
jgi:predicted RNA methylase